MYKYLALILLFNIGACGAENVSPENPVSKQVETDNPALHKNTVALCELLVVSQNSDTNSITEFPIFYIDTPEGRPKISEEQIKWTTPNLETRRQQIPKDTFCYLMKEL